MKWHWNQSRRLIPNIKYGLLCKTVDRMVLIQLIDFNCFPFVLKHTYITPRKKFTVYSNQWCPVADTAQTITITKWLNLLISPLDKLMYGTENNFLTFLGQRGTLSSNVEFWWAWHKFCFTALKNSRKRVSLKKSMEKKWKNATPSWIEFTLRQNLTETITY